MNYPATKELVLALYPTSRGYAFVLFEGELSPYDWGVKDIRKGGKNEAAIKNIRRLVERYHPDHILIEDYTEPGSRRSARIRKLYRMIGHLAESESIEFRRITKSEVRACFATVGAKTKYEIAQAIAQEMPALTHRLPRLRQIWMSEDPRQSLFDAAALGLVFYAGKVGGK